MITPEELRRLAQLAKLEIKDGEMDALTQQMERIVAFADTIQNADISPANETVNAAFVLLREDEVLPSLPREDVLKNAANTANGCFVARKRGATE